VIGDQLSGGLRPLGVVSGWLSVIGDEISNFEFQISDGCVAAFGLGE